MDKEKLEAIKYLRSLGSGDFIIELERRLGMNDERSLETRDRAIDLESALYFLLSPRSTPRGDGNTAYKQVEKLLRPHQPQLRNPALYPLICKKAKVAGATYVNDNNSLEG